MRGAVIRRRGIEQQISRDARVLSTMYTPTRQGSDATVTEFVGRIQPLATARRWFGSSVIHEERDATSSRWVILTEYDVPGEKLKPGDEVLVANADGGTTMNLIVIKHDAYAYKNEILCEERI